MDGGGAPAPAPSDSEALAKCQADIATTQASLSELVAKLTALEVADRPIPQTLLDKVATLETELAATKGELSELKSRRGRVGRSGHTPDEPPTLRPELQPAPTKTKTARGLDRL